MKTAADIMTKSVISVNPESSLFESVNLIQKHRFNGLPVIDGENKIVGIITEYDLILKGSSIHLPTFMKLFRELDLYKKDTYLIQDDLKKIINLKVRDIMNSEPLVIPENTSIFGVINIFTEHHRVNPLIVANSDNKLVGVISRSDMLKFFDSSELKLKENMNQQEVQQNIKIFLNNFEKNFILVGKGRTKMWLVTSILFSIVGFIIAWMMILRINL